ncbi:MAG: hypothetical protein AVO33_00055 [delta proteobacterium ML8_F1]|nr:MAG: hypothetical protein AVO33_00055 [delta proteobacterium ML8_F1]
MEQIRLKNTLNLKIYSPPGARKGTLLILHGMLEHLDRYQDLIKRLNGHGYAVAGFNYFGHGDNTPLGVMTPEMIPGILSGIKESVEILVKRDEEAPVTLLGHSLGSFLARLVLDEVPVNRVILSGAGRVDPKKVGRTGFALKLVAPFIDRDRPRQWLSDMVFKDFNRPFGGTAGALFISSEASEQAAYLADPLTGGPISLGFAQLLIHLMTQVRHKENALKAIDVPLVFISGEMDPVGEFGRGVRAVADDYRAINASTTKTRLFRGRHEILRDLDREEVIQEILAQLKG